MKKFLKILIVIAIVVVIYFVSVYFKVGPLGSFGYNYLMCENGFYGKYPKNTVDSGVTYYDSSNNVVGVSCGLCLADDSRQQELDKKVGQCTEVSYWKFFSKTKLGL